MALPSSVEAVKNERTGKLFIVLDWDVDDNKIKVINPNGDVLDVVKLIFKMDEPVTVSADKFSSSFSPEQLKKLENYEREQFEAEERRRLERAAKASQRPERAASSSGTRKRASRDEGMIDRKASTSGRRPVVQWTSTELTFYKHRIDGLKPNDIFAIAIEGQGLFQITKADFQRVFNNVIMNADYRTQGVFKYAELPEAAKPFIRA